ncbi:Uncharacterised protein [Vibrio cholerae]|nr:Uncharacterised protein [Vibrio cholerae]
MDRNCKQVKQKYKEQRYNAENIRSIPWEFTFTTWCDLWESSGKWEERGKKADQYVMGRKGDIGAYSPDNCYIITNIENTKEGHITSDFAWFKSSEAAKGKLRGTEAYYILNGERFEKQQEIVEVLGKSLRWVQKLVSLGVIGKYKDETYKLYVTPAGQFRKFKDALESCGESLRGGKITRQTLWHRFNNPEMPEYYTTWVTESVRLNAEANTNNTSHMVN